MAPIKCNVGGGAYTISSGGVIEGLHLEKQSWVRWRFFAVLCNINHVLPSVYLFYMGSSKFDRNMFFLLSLSYTSVVLDGEG